MKRELATYPIDVTSNEDDSGVATMRYEIESVSRVAREDFGVDVLGVSLEDAVSLPIFAITMMEAGTGECDNAALYSQYGTHARGIGTKMELMPAAAEVKDDLIRNRIKSHHTPDFFAHVFFTRFD